MAMADEVVCSFVWDYWQGLRPRRLGQLSSQVNRKDEGQRRQAEGNREALGTRM